jgi:hypothetical protein
MNNKAIVDGTTEKNPEFMRKLFIANEVTLTECFNDIKRNKAVLNFHLSVYYFQQSDLYNGNELAAAVIDMRNNCEMIINKINELK